MNKSVQRRAFERMPVNINICFFFKGMFYSGVVTNLSQRGMFIRTMVDLPVELDFLLIIRREAEVSNVPVKVRHHRRGDYNSNGIGVEITGRSEDFYAKWIEQK